MRDLPEEILSFFGNETNLKRVFEINSALEKFKLELIEKFYGDLKTQLNEMASHNDRWFVSEQTWRGQKGLGIELNNLDGRYPISPWIGVSSYKNNSKDPWIYLFDVSKSQSKEYGNFSGPLKKREATENKNRTYHKYFSGIWPNTYKNSLDLLDKNSRISKVHEVKNEILLWKKIVENELG